LPHFVTLNFTATAVVRIVGKTETRQSFGAGFVAREIFQLRIFIGVRR
jgi:hypothetical protein